MLKVKIFYQFCCDYGANIYLIKTDKGHKKFIIENIKHKIGSR